MKVTPTALPEVLVVEPKVFGDSRGFFYESWNERAFLQAGITAHFVQDNHSRSEKNVIRGLHYQIGQPQGKLVRAIAGSIFDVVVDIRRSSPRFGQWVGVALDAKAHNALWVPVGFAHGFCVTSDVAEVLYKASDFYAPQHERSIQWNDPTIGVAWPLSGPPIISPKDANAPPFAAAEVFD